MSRRKITVTVSEDTYMQLLGRAEDNHLSVATEASHLLRCGLKIMDGPLTYQGMKAREIRKYLKLAKKAEEFIKRQESIWAPIDKKEGGDG